MGLRIFGATQSLLFYAVTFMLWLPAPSLAQSIEQRLATQSDIPEEILETEIIVDARSPLDGSPLTPAEYAQLQEELRVARGDVSGRVSPKIHQALVLLRLRKVLSTIFPFLF